MISTAPIRRRKECGLVTACRRRLAYASWYSQVVTTDSKRRANTSIWISGDRHETPDRHSIAMPTMPDYRERGVENTCSPKVRPALVTRNIAPTVATSYEHYSTRSSGAIRVVQGAR